MRKNPTARVLAGVATLAAVSMGPALAGGSIAEAANKAPHSSTTIKMALNQTLAGWNVFTSNDNQFVLNEILNLIWPSPFITTNKLALVQNTDIVSKVADTVVGPVQTVTYTINPKAEWSDGTPITADDFIYAWQAQCGGQSADPYCSDNWKDIGNQPYDDAGTSGYNQIQSVVGSKPAKGSCAAGSTADRNAGLCPNGLTVTVTFEKNQPYSDWQGLFGLVPAHVARVHGWNTLAADGNTVQGFSVDPVARVLSAEQYKLQSYDSTGNNVVLVKNPDYHGSDPGKADSIVFVNESNDDNGVSDMSNGSFQVWEPNSTSLAYVQTAQAAGLHTSVVPGLQFEHFDFNESNPYLAKVQVRQAIAYATDRAAIIKAVDQAAPGTKPLDNRMFMNNQATYVANGKAYDAVDLKKAASLMTAAGFKKVGGYWQPTFGPQKGQDLTLQDYSTTASLRGQVMQLWQNQMKNFGIKIGINQIAAGKLFGTVGPKGEFDIIEFAWVGGVFPSGNQAIYCSYNLNACSSNWDHFSDKAVDKLLFAGPQSGNFKTEVADYNKADALLWADMATLPIYQKPVMVAYTNVNHVLNNPGSAGVTWNAQDWTVS